MPVTLESACLGKLMRFAMKAQGFTQVALAKRAGCNQSQVSRLFRGQFNGETECLSQVCSVLNIQLRSNSKNAEEVLEKIGLLLRAEGARKPAGGRARRLNATAAKRRQAIEQALRSIAALA